MDNLYIVESPLQALCALEISLKREKETHGIIVKISDGGRSRNDEQLMFIVHQRKWDYLSIVPTHEKKHRFFNALSNYFQTQKTFSHLKEQFPSGVRRLYLGEFLSLFMHQAKCVVGAEEVHILDDGTSTINLAHTYFKQGYYFPNNKLFFKNRIKKALPNAFHFKTLNFATLNQKIILSTVYKHVDYDQINPLNFSEVKRLFNQKQVIDASLIYYYGSTYSEAKITSLAYELSFLSKIADYYKSQGKKIVYFAHRYESPEKLRIIKEELGFDISMPEQMGEVFLLTTPILPAEISGACSSILINCSVLFPEVQLRSFKLSGQNISAPFRSKVEMIYDYMQKSGMTVSTLEN